MKLVITSKKYGEKIVTISDEDYDLVSKYTWAIAKRGKTFYAASSKWGYGVIYMHRLILKAKKGELIDHKDRNGLNNQRDNIRKCTGQQNKSNVSSHSDSKSMYVGVTWYKNYNKWEAQITNKGKHYKLGYFENERDAASAYNLKAIELKGEFANINIL